jgi:Ca-activated chloride channel family protein
VLLIAIVAMLGLHVGRRRLASLAAPSLLRHLVPRFSMGRKYLRAILVLLAMVLLVVCLIDPRWGVTRQEVRQQGIDIQVVLDVSRSMLAEDAAPNRLERSRQYILDLVEQLGGDRIGLITAAGTPAVACPLTIDYGAFRLALEQVGPQTAARGGSLLGDALRLAESSFTDEIKDYKAVIVFSDGEDHGSFPLEAAAGLYEEQGIRIYTVGVGDADEGARIPVDDGRYLVYEGQEVWSRMDAGLLRSMALDSGGAYIPAGTSNIDMGQIYQERIAPVTKRQFGTTTIERHHAQYQWFAAAALALLLIESLISDRRSTPRESPA